MSRNPLKSGQCFLPVWGKSKKSTDLILVAIPSNRVNVSYTPQIVQVLGHIDGGRNPLKSGQCFLHRT